MRRFANAYSIDLSKGGKIILKLDGFERSNALPKTPTDQVPAIEIQTEENGEWITRSRFYPKEYKAYGVFDLKQYLDSSNIGIRLLSKSCEINVATLIDYVAIDNSTDQCATNSLTLTKALKDNSTDVLNLVTAADNNYLELNGGSSLELEFDNIATSGINDYFFISKGFYNRGGNTFYVYTKDNSNTWQERWVSKRDDFQGGDITKEIDLSSYESSTFPNLDGTYQIKVENVGKYYLLWAYIDYVYLKVNDIMYKIKNAFDKDNNDILTLLKASDDNRWNAANSYAIITFEPVTRGICFI